MPDHDEFDPDAPTALERLEETASAASADLEDKLSQLKTLTEARRKDPQVERQYLAIRDGIVRILQEHGPRYFLDSFGRKHYAYAISPEPLIVDVAVLEAMVEAGELSEEVLDEVAPRKVVAEAFKRACNAGRITDAQLLDSAHKEKGTAYVGYADPDRDDG
jgi:hypothetical protein